MPTFEDAVRLACGLEGASLNPDGTCCEVGVGKKKKGFLWVWRERVDPKKPRVLNHSVIAVRVASLSVKEVLLDSFPAFLFTEPHYDGYAAVLVRLADVPMDQLEDLLVEAWRGLQKSK